MFFSGQQKKCAWVAVLRRIAAGGGFCECDAVSGKMSTFVSGKKRVGSRRYAEFMSTFVYLVRIGLSRKIKELASKNVYFYILLTTFHVGREGYRLISTG